MADRPSDADLQLALAAAGLAHHEYEQKFLDGVRDEQWPGWYAAYVLGRLEDFISPSSLTRWLENVRTKGDWSAAAGKYADQQLVLSNTNDTDLQEPKS